MLSDFEKDKVFWTKRMNLKLVKFIQSRPQIWNPKHPKYTSVEARDRTYNEFASKFGNSFSAQAVKDRWTNIRCTFNVHLRKLFAASSKNNGEEYKINWPLWEPCQFLMKVSKKVKAEQSNSDTCPDGVNNIDNFAENIEEKYLENEYASSDEEIKDVDGTNIIQESEPICRTIAENIAEIFREFQSDAFGIHNTNNVKIGTLVGSTLSQINSFEAAQACQKITNILMLFDESNPINPNNLKIEN